MDTKIKKQKKIRRQKRTRARISAVKSRPRFSVFRSNKHIYAQLIDNKGNVILASVSDKGIKSKTKGKIALAFEAGKLLAEKAKKLQVEKVVFDRSGYKYHGRVKALAEGARERGLIF
jgi:large subunit ribosomal protein L18